MIDRTRHRERLTWLLRTFPVVAILGARQVGKTTLARALGESFQGPVTHFDLESAADLALLADPALTLGPLRGLVILDEIQRRPELFPALRVLADRPGVEAKFLRRAIQSSGAGGRAKRSPGRTTAPQRTRSMVTALEDLALDHIDVIHAGERTFPLAQQVRAVAAHDLLGQLEPLRSP